MPLAPTWHTKRQSRDQDLLVSPLRPKQSESSHGFLFAVSELTRTSMPLLFGTYLCRSSLIGTFHAEYETYRVCVLGHRL